jgi:hypothetical protein
MYVYFYVYTYKYTRGKLLVRPQFTQCNNVFLRTCIPERVLSCSSYVLLRPRPNPGVHTKQEKVLELLARNVINPSYLFMMCKEK